MYTSNLVVTRRNEGTTEIIEASGEIDVLSVDRFKSPLRAAAESADALVVDLRGVTYIDSAGLESLIGAHSRMSKRSKTVTVLVKAGSQPQEVIHIVRLDTLLRVTSDPSAAGAQA